MMSNFKLPKWAVMIVAAFVFLPLAIDWVQPGVGARLAMEWLGSTSEQARGHWTMFPIWRWLVGLAGRDVCALGTISVGAGLVCVALVAAIVGTVFDEAIRFVKEGNEPVAYDFRFVESAATLLAGLAFALTPGFLVAATRVSPLMVALVPPLAAAALAARKGCLFALLTVVLAGCLAGELVLARRGLFVLVFPTVVVWLAVGMTPALVMARCVRNRWLVSCKVIWSAFGVWATAIAVMGAMAFTSGKLEEGRIAERIVSQIVANAEDGDKVAVVSDGTLDELFFFMLPEKVKLISLARERDPAYGRELSEWVKARGEDLAFAAELGPRALVDEWMKVDKSGFEAAVATVATYFPTREAWEAACGELKGLRDDEPMAGYLRHLMGVCGNAMGCRIIEELRVKREELRVDGEREAWAIFRKIVDEVDPNNYAAFVNLQGMVERGYAVSKDEMDDLTRRRQQIEKDLKVWDQVVFAAWSGGQVYADPEAVAKFEREQREQAAKRELTPEQKAFVATISTATKDMSHGKVAQGAIHKAIRDGKVRIDLIGGLLVTIDLALGDSENAEKDAIDVLKTDRHDPTANAALGALALTRGDYERAERYLKRAIATGRASDGAKNDFAWVLYRQGRYDEAETFARDAVLGAREAWAVRETLAAILIRKGKIVEGERELEKAERLAEKAGLQKEQIVSLQIDRARLLMAKNDETRFKVAIRVLRNRKDLTPEQQDDVREMEKWK